MAIFSFFKRPKPKSFNFKPRYYDPDKERISEILDRNKDENIANPEAMKSRISQGFKRKGMVDARYASKQRRKSNYTLLLTLVLLIVLSFVLFSRYLPILVNMVE